MTASVTHHKVVVTPDDGTSEVGSDEWNAGHDISIAPADIGASATGHDHDAAYDAIGAAAGAETAAEGYADSAVATHTGDSSAAHAASAVAVTPVGAVGATDVQAAIQELDTEKSATGHNHSGTYDPAGSAATAQSTAEGYADSAVSTHAGLADPHTGYLQESVIGGITDSTSTTSSTTAASATAAKAAFDVGNGKPSLSANAAVTQAFGDSAANGSGTAAAKDDHKHGMPAAPPTVGTDTLWDAVGDLAVGSGANTAAKLTAGSDDYVLMADASVTGVGLKWAAPGATPSTQAFGDSAAAGTTDGYERAGHKHAMPAAPTTVANDTLWAAKGDIVVATANDASAALTAPTARSAILGADAVGNVAWAPDQAGPKGVRYSDDFNGYNTGFGVATNAAPMIGYTQGALTGTASTIGFNPISSVPNHPGIISMGTGSTSLGRVALSLANNGNVSLGGGRYRMGAWVYLPALSTSAQRFEITVGFADGFSDATIVDGCSFNYKDSVNSGAWSVTTVSNSTSTLTHQVTTGTTANATTWYLLEVEVNAAGSSVDYLVNGTVAVTHSANIPTGAGRETGAYISILKSAGATTSLLYCDAYYVEMDFTTAR